MQNKYKTNTKKIPKKKTKNINTSKESNGKSYYQHILNEYQPLHWFL